MDSITKLTFRARVLLKAKLKMYLDRTRDNIERQKLSALNDATRTKQEGEDSILIKHQNNAVVPHDLLSSINGKDINSNQTEKLEPPRRTRVPFKVNLLQAIKE